MSSTSKTNKGVKLSLGEFMGGGGDDQTPPPPSGPRGDYDSSSGRGGYQSRYQHSSRGGGGGGDGDYNTPSVSSSRGDQDNNWRRGGGGGGGGGSGYRDDRGGGGGYSGDRGGGGGYNRSDDRGGGGYGSRSGGGYRGGEDRDRDSRGGGGYGGSSEGGSWRGSGGGGGDSRGGGSSRFGGGGPSSSRYGSSSDTPPSSSGPPSGERPRLHLKQRTPARPSDTSEGEKAVEATATKLSQLNIKQSKEEEDAPITETASKSFDKEDVGQEDNDKDATDAGSPERKGRDAPRVRREPEVVNPRAAALGESAPSSGPSSGTSNRDRRDRPTDRGPPPVRNKMFEQLAEEERASSSTYRDQPRGGRDDRGPDMRRGGPPPQVANSRFAAAAEADRSPNYNRDERGPPPVANSRFAAAAAMAEEERPSPRDDYRGGPPPQITNSRFAAAAAMAEEEPRDHRGPRRDRDYGSGDRREGGGMMRGDDRGPPVPQNSRFAQAVLADSDYMDRDERERQRMDRDERNRDRDRDRNYRGGPRDGGGYTNRAALPTGPRGEEYRGDDFKELEQRAQEQHNRVADVLKPKAPPPMENMLQIPVKSPAPEHEANMLKIPDKGSPKREGKGPEAPVKSSPPKSEPKAEPAAPKPTGGSEELLAEFISGDRKGDELKVWVEQNRASLPPVEKLVFELLKEHEKLNPDPECAWAEPTNFGAALLALVEDDVLAQMRVLWGIQFYCDKLGFPKLNNESVVQSMFRAMYKYDLADADAFAEWKEDESDEYATGKLNAVIQTVEWFNWLEADEDGDEEGDEEED